MVPVERFYRAQLLGEKLADIEGDIAVIETSLGDGHSAEINAYSEASELLLRARKALDRAQAEAFRRCQADLLRQQLSESVLRFRNGQRSNRDVLNFRERGHISHE